MITIIRIEFTRHALEKIDALGLAVEEVESVIRMGMKWREEGTEKWHVNMSGIEVVFVKIEEVIRIITVYLAEAKR